MVRNSEQVYFVSRRDRDAWAPIRGYVYQVDSTILRWVMLKENEALELERGEDIDIIAPAIWKERGASQRVLEQIKCLDGSITLRSRAALESLARFHEHRQTNQRGALDLLFRFSTTALPAHEKPAGPLTFTPGVLLWERARSSGSLVSAEQDCEAILAFLRKTRKPRGFSAKTWKSFAAFLKSPKPDFLRFIRAFEWSTGLPPSERLSARVCESMVESGYAHKTAEAMSKYDQLFAYVIRLLAKPPVRGRRILTKRDLCLQISKTAPDPALARFLAEFRELRDFLSRELSTITKDLAEVKGNTREILYELKSKSTRAVALERVVEPGAILRAFGTASQSLISWPQETDGRWIERPALQELETILLSDGPTFTALLGDPGSGKSALLSRVAVRLRDSGVAFLALKIDRLPKTVRSLPELDSEWFPECGLIQGVRALAKERRVVVLIDQLDALASLMDQQTTRLDIVIQVLQVLRGTPNVHVILSCREFDFKYDSRFDSVEARQVHLADPPWEAVEPILRESGLDASRWPTESRDLLRKPQHLKVFLTLLSSDPLVHVFSSYQGMLEAVFAKRVIEAYGASAARTCETIATAMGATGEIWLPLLQFDAEHHTQIEQLSEAGILRKDGRLIGFQHQTMFDYVRVRSFCSGMQNLSSYVLEHQNTLFVRSTLWAAAISMRSLVRTLYHKEVGALWHSTSLRKHVRFLLISFLGQVTDPDDEETQWLLPSLEGPLRGKLLISMAGSPGWFSKLRSRLPHLMSCDDQQLSWELMFILRAALGFDRPGVLDLVRLRWGDAKKDGFVLGIFRELKNWDPASIDVVRRIVSRSTPDPYYLQTACESIAATQPDLAADLLATGLDRKLTNAGELPESMLLSNEWYGIEKLGEQTPWPILKRLWPWLRGLFDRSPKRVIRNAVEYRREDNWQLDEAIEQPGLMLLFRTLLVRYAGGDPVGFRRFLAEKQGTDLMILHRLIAFGLQQVVSTSPEVVLDYLTSDPRRLNLGNYSNAHKESQMLIAAVVPHLSTAQAADLEEYINGWHYYREFTQGDAAMRRDRRRWDRTHRLQLLGAFPLERLSLAGRRLRREKGIALRERAPTKSDEEMHIIGSPMTVESMEKASTDAILRLFTELHDGTGFDHPRDFMRGGSVQASQAFGELAKRKPDKALAIVREFKPGMHESPAAQAIQAFSKATEVPAGLVLELVHKLDKAGFRSSEFRQSVSWALTDLSARVHGLPEQTCKLLECWLEPPEKEAIPSAAAQAPQLENVDALRRENVHGRNRSERPASLLWGHGLGWFAHGNYPILRAITYGYLRHNVPNTESWLSVLERHLDIREDAEVWTSLLLDLRFMRMAPDTKRVADFTRRLMRTYPSAFASVEGLMFLAWNHSLLPGEISHKCLRIWGRSKWKERGHAIGEFSMLRHAQVPGDNACARIVNAALSKATAATASAQARRVGIGFTAINLWSDPDLRGACHKTILRLFPLATNEIRSVVMDVFRVSHPMPPDGYTIELLQLVMAEPKMLAEYSTLASRLKALLGDGLDPLLIAGVANAILDEGGRAIGDYRNRWARDSAELTQLAMTLQKIEASQAAGLELFERLMDLGAHEADQVLRELDRKLT
jgi:hypothetical protein